MKKKKAAQGHNRSPQSQKVLSLDKRKVVGVSTIYGHGGHLVHVTWIFYIRIGSPFLQMLHIKFGFVSEMFEYYVNIHVY